MRRLGLLVAVVAMVAAGVPAGRAATAGSAPPGSVPPSRAVPASWFGGTPARPDGQIGVGVVSGLPSPVTGESARVDVRGVDAGDVLRVERDGTDVTGVFSPAGNGVVDGVV